MNLEFDKGTARLPEGVLLGDRYRIVRSLRSGGMGAVYEAENTWTGRRVVVKVMRAEVARDADFTRRFLQEAQAASRIEHPNVVAVLDMGEDRAFGMLYIVQELLVGHDLRAHLNAAGRLPPCDALAIVVPVMEALVMAHAKGVVHRDLKPGNIFLAETPRGVVPKLIDFGVAKVLDRNGRSLQKTVTLTMLGTPSYMAPEQALGDASLDARADVWSLGVVLYEMLSGLRPHGATSSSELLAKIIYEEPTPLTEVAPDLPADLASVVMGALQRNPAMRYASMQAFLDALWSCVEVCDASVVDVLPLLPSSSSVRLSASSPLRPESKVPREVTMVPRVESLRQGEARPRRARSDLRRAVVAAVAVTALVTLARTWSGVPVQTSRPGAHGMSVPRSLPMTAPATDEAARDGPDLAPATPPTPVVARVEAPGTPLHAHPVTAPAATQARPAVTRRADTQHGVVGARTTIARPVLSSTPTPTPMPTSSPRPLFPILD